MEAFLAYRISKFPTRKAPCNSSLGKEWLLARLVAAAAAGILPKSEAPAAVGCAHARLDCVDTELYLNINDRNHLVQAKVG
jgi:hypothetical protein